MKLKKMFLSLFKNNDENSITRLMMCVMADLEYNGNFKTINATTNVGWTALMLAAYRGEIKWVEYLIRNGANIDIKDDNGLTALMLASMNNSNSTVNALLRTGADPNIQAWNGKTALMLASQKNSPDVIATLLANSSTNPDIRDNKGNTTLMYLAYMVYSYNTYSSDYYASIECIKILLSAGADPNIKNNAGITINDYLFKADWRNLKKSLTLRRKKKINLAE